MSGLFAWLYLDEDVDILIATLLRARGFDVHTVHELGQEGRTDEEQLTFAVSERRVLVTHNRRDFERLAAQYVDTGRPHAGMILAGRRDPYELARRLLVLLNTYSADEFADQIRYV